MISRIVLKNSVIDNQLSDDHNIPCPSDKSIDNVEGINISRTYLFLRSFILDDEYGSSNSENNDSCVDFTRMNGNNIVDKVVDDDGIK